MKGLFILDTDARVLYNMFRNHFRRRYMKRQTLKICALAFILAITLILGTSCRLPMIPAGSCDHSYIEPGDCQNPGKCKVCNAEVGELGSHRYVSNVVAPGCTSAGYTDYECSICGDSYRGRETEAVGHQFGGWIFSKQPTTTEAGEMYRECSVCSTVEKETVAPHVHTLESGAAKPVTCTEDGWNAFEYCTQCEYSTKSIIKATGHEWGPYTSNGNGTHTRVCSYNSAHTSTEPCSGGSFSAGNLPVCDLCHQAYDFAAREGNSTYGYHALASYSPYGEDMQRLYKDMTAACEEFYFSNEDVAYDDGYYVIAEFDLNDYSLHSDAGSAVWKVFYVSNPLYYWLDARIVTAGSRLYLTVADDYAKASDRLAADTAIADMTEGCEALIDDDMTDLERAMTIAAYIVENMEYAYESDGETPVDDMWAHCMAGFAMYDLGVCEAYAKSFMYLCLLNEVECIMGAGYAGEPHAWNYVKLDGEWYGADITWTDNSGSTVCFDSFGLSSAEIFKDHFPGSSTVFSGDFIYAAPKLADEGIRLTALYKNDEYVGMYKSLDDAFAAMTDQNGEYTVDIGFYSFYNSAPVHTIKSAATPNVKKLTIVGRNQPTEPGYFDINSVICISGELTLGSDVVLQNVHVMPSDNKVPTFVDLAGHTLKLDGRSVYVEVKIFGTEATSVVVASTEERTVFDKGVDIYRLVIENDGVVFGADSHLVYCPSDGLYVSGGADVDIENYT